jgi:hypothetical protein
MPNTTKYLARTTVDADVRRVIRGSSYNILELGVDGSEPLQFFIDDDAARAFFDRIGAQACISIAALPSADDEDQDDA